MNITAQNTGKKTIGRCRCQHAVCADETLRVFGLHADQENNRPSLIGTSFRKNTMNNHVQTILDEVKALEEETGLIVRSINFARLDQPLFLDNPQSITDLEITIQ